MTRVIRPIGAVTAALKKHGYRQQAVILVDGKQLPNVAVLSIKAKDKTKFEGHYIDANGELHKTTAFVDAKKAAARILLIREQVLTDNPEPKPKRTPPKRAPQQRRQHTATATVHSIGAMIDCKGCGTRHADDTLCPE